MTEPSSESIRQTVRQEYSKIAQGQSSCCGGASDPEKFAEAIGYSRQELQFLPEGANMGLSCGNPTALADLKPGQVVLDLGSGGGLDVFIAAQKVGPAGRAIGVDMTPDMISKARASIAAFTQKTGLDNVEFRLGEIEHLPVADASIDVVISNCVINLSPDKQQVWNEIARVLKPGGKACISDLALLEPLPTDIQKSVSALIGCLAGAVWLDETKAMIASAGLINLQVTLKNSNLEAMAECNDSLYQAVRRDLPPGRKLSDYIVSADLTASKQKEEPFDSRQKELIAIGASVACNCHPCVQFHLRKAQELHIESKRIRLAVEVGKMVRKGAADQMDEALHSQNGF